jgi:hypothetical protein
MNNKINKKSPAKLNVFSFISGGIKLATTLGGGNPYVGGAMILGGVLLANKMKKNKSKAALGDAQEEFEAQLQRYKDSKFQPIDPSIADRENIFEDMEIDTSGFEMQRKAFLQQQANIIQGLQMAGGSSGAAGLAQALSIQGDKQTEQMGMTVTQMLNKSKELRLQEQGRINNAITNIELANAEGSRQFEIDKLNTLMGVAGQKIAGIRGDIAGKRQMYGQMAQGFGSILGASMKLNN